MRLTCLEVQDFRGIRAATIPFEKGLNVLHGRNELGKSTLVEAIHAALFLQSTSQAGYEHVTWGGSSAACVTLTFEHGGKLWRVSKRFGKKGSATLERSDSEASQKFKVVVEGKGVEGELRKLLAWGIAPPGGKGAGPKVESFLLTALLGRQGEVQKVLSASLGKDSDDTGKSLVTNAIGASSIDQRLASRVLPTSEQIAAWRRLEEELKASPAIAPTAPSSPLTAVVLASVCVLVVVAAATRVGLGLPLLTAVLAGLVVAGVLGAAIWLGLQGRVAAQSAEYERSGRRRDQWTQEVKPSLLAAGLAKLADYESAVAEVQRQRAEAQRLRQQADQDDRDAGEAQSSAARLDSRRELLGRLESEAPPVDVAAVSARAAEYNADVNKVRLRIAEVQQALEATRGRLRADADTSVTLAIVERTVRQAEYDAAARALTAAETTLTLAERQSDPEEVARLRAQLAEIWDVDHPAGVGEASKALDEAKTQNTTASTTADMLSGQLDQQRSAVERRVNALDGDLEIARQHAQQSLDAVTSELAALDLPDAVSYPGGSELERATKEHARLEEQFAADKTTLESATKQQSDAEGDLKALETHAATLRGKLTFVDRPALESRLQQATGDPVFQIAEGSLLDPAAARGAVNRLQDQRNQCEKDLNYARGQLQLIAGHVGSERLAQQEEVVTLTRAEVLERELTEHAARRLLIEIEKVEAERATHLGHALAGPITDAFRELTGGRYGPISLDPDLKTTGIEVHGAAQQLDNLSVGTREQLATLLRLAIAGYLQTALVLDDQLVHGDPERLNWFRDRLRASVGERGHQVIVFTCRPSDYLSPDWQAADSVAVVDLTVQLHRAIPL